MKSLVKNFSYSVFANLISTISSAALLLVIPKFISVAGYGYWQLYLFYGSYIGYFHFGLLDGIYLRYGGKKYTNLNTRIFSTQFYLLTIFNSVIFLILSFLLVSNSTDINKFYIIIFTAFSAILTIPKIYLTYILQATGRIKEYSISLIADRGISFVIIALACISGVESYRPLVLLDIITKIVSLCYVVFCCKEIVFAKPVRFSKIKRELRLNVISGIKIMIASLTGMLLIGISRFEIESLWSIEVFAKISLTFSISNIIVSFINSISIVIFPMLRNYDKDKLSTLYKFLRDNLQMFLLISLLFYPVIKIFIDSYLSQYSESIKYMAILLPMCLFECKSCLLTNTFLKTVRMENDILKANIVTLFISAIFSSISLLIFKNIELCLFFIVLSIATRNIYSEILLNKKFRLKLDLISDTIISLIFIFAFLCFDIYVGTMIYALVLAYYLFKKRNVIENTIKLIKRTN